MNGRVAVVTGASKGVGRGIALGLGEAGGTVYVTGRSARALEDTAAEITRLGGRGIAAPCDHERDDKVAALFERTGPIDVLVNNAFATPDLQVLWSGKPFWEIPTETWDHMMNVGLRSHFIASRHAMAHGVRLIVNVASNSAATPKSPKSRAIVPYSVGKAALHRLTA